MDSPPKEYRLFYRRLRFDFDIQIPNIVYSKHDLFEIGEYGYESNKNPCWWLKDLKNTVFNKAFAFYVYYSYF